MYVGLLLLLHMNHLASPPQTSYTHNIPLYTYAAVVPCTSVGHPAPYTYVPTLLPYRHEWSGLLEFSLFEVWYGSPTLIPTISTYFHS